MREVEAIPAPRQRLYRARSEYTRIAVDVHIVFLTSEVLYGIRSVLDISAKIPRKFRWPILADHHPYSILFNKCHMQSSRSLGGTNDNHYECVQIV